MFGKRFSKDCRIKSQLLKLFLTFPLLQQGTPRSPDVAPEPSGMKSEAAAPSDGDLGNELSMLVKVKYEAAVAPPPPPEVPPPREKLTQADWDRIRCVDKFVISFGRTTSRTKTVKHNYIFKIVT